MHSAPGSPSNNKLTAGVTEEQIIAAVENSGFPLQTIIGDILRPTFGVQDEWCYVDRDTKELRTIDIRAQRRLHGWDPQPRVRPLIDMVIECKQSDLPYIFFESRSAQDLRDFPIVAGLANKNIELITDDDASTWTFRVSQVLELHSESFCREPPYCNSFSKCVRKGKDLELSGSDTYTGLILPLVKAVQHLTVTEQPVPTAWYFDAHLVLAVGVLDAPMIAASVDGDSTRLTFTPWVRVGRHEYLEVDERWERDHRWMVDIVHRAFFLEYIERYVTPFAQRFSERVLSHSTELATGKGFVSGMGAEPWNLTAERLKPRPFRASLKRTNIIARNFVRLFRGVRPE